MIDRAWDVILIGAGQNSFALGTYMGMAGLRTVICESRLENGGRLATEEITRPGYWHNTLAYFHDNRALSPVWRELGWDERHHAAFHAPTVIRSLLFPDGRSISQHRSLAATLESIARFSPRDAEVWRELHGRYGPVIRDVIMPAYYEPPGRNGGLSERLSAVDGGARFERLARLSAERAVDELFESDAVKVLLLSQMAIPRGFAIDDDGGGLEILKMIAGDENPELARGGAHAIAQVLQRAYVRNGGQIRAVHHVDRILVEHGRAVGVRLRDGREWTARRAVVSDVDPYSTFITMVGEEHLDEGFARRVKAIEPDEFSQFQVHLALKAPVRYAIHEARDPAVSRALSVTFGPQTVAELAAMWNEIRSGEFPRHACLHAICPTLFDPLQAPPNRHTASLFLPVPFELAGRRPEDWIRLKHEFMERALALWRGFATNLTEANIEMKAALDPFYIAGRWPHMRRGSVWVARKVPGQMFGNRPLPELAGYRTPIEGLYQIGVATHPADAVIAGSGRNAWRVIKEDLHLEIP
ncbi:MAG TPA: NAD(P)/FAD-dependent oxidoreductase [Candidatus Eisenbacteria bacterium]|nr:NAD(P)/FAD-dependent oxidoreductase [Candidatus Eisenbacteria bacterium]